jgi:SAM-dependent methyltransferase
MTSATPRPTFRDPAGSLRLEDDQAIRTIHPAAREEVLAFLASPFCHQLQQRGDLIAASIEHEPADHGDGPDSVGSADALRLLHPRVFLPTYPWEWTASQWLAAAELTLTLGEEALGHGWILKDATPHNILFIGARPVLVDILSFERRDPTSSVWLAYAQYIRTFLLPLLMNKLLHWPLALSLFKRDGLEPLELYRSLSWPQRLSPAAFFPVTLPAWLERRQEGKTQRNPHAMQGTAALATDTPTLAPPGPPKEPELTLHLLKRTLQSLRKRTRAAVSRAATSEWSEYTGSLTHYTAAQVAEKNSWLNQVLGELRPARVLDVGANTGEYSILAASHGAEVVALERDEAAADRLFKMSVQKAAQGLSIQTIHADLARPTPAVGWDNDESSALLPRLESRFDLVLMLAVIHHLLLLEQIPLDDILALCHRLTTRHLVVEWVPASDPMYQSLMRGRDALYGHINEDRLLAACTGRFETRRRLTLDNGRILLLFEKI